MHSLKIFIITLSLSFGLASCKQWKGVESAQKQEMDIYLLIGQSNMAGRAPVEAIDKDTLANVFLLKDSLGTIWEPAANPLNKYSTVRKNIGMQKLGSGYTFAQELAKAHPTKRIGLVVNAKGGTKIDLWMPGQELYDEAVRRTKAAIKFGELKGVIWHQGESDASNYETYTLKIIGLIEGLRKDFDIPDLPVVVGQLSEDKAKRKGFNDMILELPTKIKCVGVVTTEDTHTIDSTHFDAKSQRLLGVRYAQEMIKKLDKELL